MKYGRFAVVAIAAVACVLAIASSAGAGTTYNDGASGNWSAVGTWGGGPPGALDTAIIDSHTVTADVKIDSTITLVDIQTNGTLYIGNSLQTSPAASLQLNGGTLRVEGNGPSAYNPLVVKAASTLQSATVAWNTPYYLYGTMSDFAVGTTGLITASGRISLNGDGSAFSGGWDLLPTYTGNNTPTSIGVNVANALGSGQTTVRSGAYLDIGAVGATIPSLVDVYGEMAVRPASTLAVRMENGGLYDLPTGNTVSGTMFVNGGTSYLRATRNDQTYYNGAISGSGKLSLETRSGDSSTINLGGDNSGFTGAWDINALNGAKRVVLTNANALGLNVVAGNPTGLVTIKSGSDLRLGAAMTLARDFTMENGATVSASSNGTFALGGIVTLLPGQATFLTPTGNNHTCIYNIDGQITGNGGARFYGSGGNTNSHSRISVTNAGNNYIGGTVIDADYTARDNGYDLYTRVTNNGALSTGAVNVYAGALYTNPANNANPVLTSVLGDITIQGGTLRLNSTETRSFKLMEAGALRIDGGTTAMTYGGGGIFQVYNNAILDKSSIVDASLALPTLAQIHGPAAQNQVLLGYRATSVPLPAAICYYGPGGGGNGGGAGQIIWGGVAGVDYDVTIPAATTIKEYTAGGGFTLGAQKARSLTVAATASLDATGPINLVGDGAFTISGTPMVNQAGTINKTGRYMLKISSAGGLPALKTLNVNGGYLDVDAVNALTAGSITNLNQGGCFAVDQILTTGTINVNANGGIRYSAATQYATVVPTFASGSHVIFGGDGLTLPAGANGNVNYILTDWNGTQNFGTFYLNDNTRITPAGNFSGNTSARITTGEIQTLGTQGRIACPTAPTAYGAAALAGVGNLYVYSKVNFSSQKLIIGDASTFNTFNAGGTAYGPISQGGRVTLANSTNVIGSIDIQSGTLDIPGSGPGYNDESKLGGATLINVASGATLDMHSDWFATWTLKAMLTGSGTVMPRYINNNGGPSALVIQPGYVGGVVIPAGVDPGSSAGKLTMNVSGLTFNKIVAGGLDVYPTLDIDITGEGNVAGVDYDQLYVKGNLTGITNVILNVGGAAGLDLDGQVFEIVKWQGTGTNVDSFFDIFFDPDWSAQIEYDLAGKRIILYNVVGPAGPGGPGTVPEPAGLGLLGLALLAVRRRRS